MLNKEKKQIHNQYYEAVSNMLPLCSMAHEASCVSPNLFSVFIDDLIRELKNSKIGVQVLDTLVNMLANADDLVLIVPTQAGLQQLLNIVESWCRKWKIQVNMDKTKIMHVRKPGVGETKYDFTYQGRSLEKVTSYKYLGVVIDYALKMDECKDVLAKAGERALGSIISKIKKMEM